MKDKNKEQLIGELAELRQRVAELEASDTERKRAEAALCEQTHALRESEELLNNILTASSVGIAHAKDRNIMWGNEAMVRLFGFTEEEQYLGKDTQMLYASEEEYRRVGRIIYEQQRAGRVVELDAKFKRQDGSLFDGYVRVNTLDPLDPIRGVIVSIIDITERKRAEEALRESELRYRTTINAMGDAIHLVGPDLRLTLANLACQQWAEDFASGTADIVGLTIFEAFPALPDEACDRLRAEYRQVFNTGETLITEESTTFGDREFITETRKIPVFENGRVSRVITVIRDITDCKRAEEEIRKRVFEQEVLREAILALTTTLDRDEVIGRILAQLQKVVPYDTASIQLLREGHLEIVGGRGFPNLEELLGVTFDPNREDNPNREVIRTRTSFVVDDAPTMYTEFLRDPHAPAGIRSWLGVPMLVGERLIGMIALDKSDPGFYTQEHAQLAEAFAAQAAVAIENAQLFEQARQELTERKQAEETLRASETRYRRLFESAKDGILILDADTGQIADVNPFLTTLLGYSQEELLGKELWEIGLFKDIFVSRTAFEELQCKGYIRYENLPLETHDGHAIAVEFVSNTYVVNHKRVIQCNIRDISERRQAEEERERLLVQIQEQAQRVEQIMDTVPEGVLMLNAAGRVVLANPVAERDLSVLADARAGDIIARLGDRPLAEFLTSPPKGLWHEIAMNNKVFELIARPMENGPELKGWVMVINDVTHQREIEQRIQQQERLAAVGQLAAGIAHDFNNIMAAIVLYAQMSARMEELPAIVRNRMETINQQAQLASNLIQQILDFSRRAVLERQPLDLALLLKEHVRLLERTLPESIEVKLTYGPGEHLVHADPTRMQQMVTNLAINARDAMPGGGTLHIGLERIEVRPGESPPLPEMEPGEWIHVTVSDTGAGIPPDILPHIFEPFFTTKAPLGSGLGLAQVHGIVGQHGGRIDVETHMGKGTTFTIYLPALLVHSSKPSGVPGPGELPTLPTGKGETILVVEDNAVVRKALVESLELLNYRTREAMNGQEALAMLEQHSDDIDLLLSDVVMPGMGGMALLHALKERGLTVRVVMMTGHSLEKELDDLRAHGMIDWLPKPPELEQLAEVVPRALGTD
jgi:two-component system cell cycle sensor histidine kinase/response regulator CckA